MNRLMDGCMALPVGMQFTSSLYPLGVASRNSINTLSGRANPPHPMLFECRQPLIGIQNVPF